MAAGKREPVEVIFFINGTTFVGDAAGRQMEEFAMATHRDTIRALREGGYDYHDLDITGQPDCE